MEEQTQSGWKQNPLIKAIGKVLLVLCALFFGFGDIALRRQWHFSFGASMLIWAGVLGGVLILYVVFSHIFDE